ncbi:FkbM family methyltransferase [bacterium]|nr:FkbM family methyltransferase [bacterium]
MLTPSRLLQAFLRRAVRPFGLELVDKQQVPERTLAGLNHIEFQILLDIGANRGDYIHYARRVLKFREMHCFEPLPGAYRQLQDTARRLAVPGLKIQTHNLGLGEENTETLIFHHPNHSVSSSLLPTTAQTGDLFPASREQEQCKIRLARLDDYVFENQIEMRSPSLIKMDVQGFENRVIAGGAQTVGSADVLQIEINFASLYQGQASFRELFEQLHQLGFSYRGNLAQLYSQDGQILSADCLFYHQRFKPGP